MGHYFLDTKYLISGPTLLTNSNNTVELYSIELGSIMHKQPFMKQGNVVVAD